ncbi:transporter substrate-binding domain-containing protein [Inediibacterium massiliense]|uniref:transporter substrate-binding domain-containing protein n=1 Tax=Inediibacterium massiliense TaxID=1658111 RepID=UPI0006B4DE24|nr:transporter substrate-binding domain-containing protein [Inediibacterium massiliense]
MFKKIMTILLIGCMVFSFAGCSKETSSADTNKLDEIKSKGKIVLGTSADYPPYEFHKVINGEDVIVGFDIEIAKAIADELGVELEIKDMKFDGLLAALVANKIDFIIAGMTPDPDRAKSVDFTKPYYAEEQSILINAKNKDKIKSKDDLKGLKIGVQKSTVQEKLAKGIEGAQVKGLSKITDLVLELSNEKIDAIIIPKPVAHSYVSSNEKLFAPEIILQKGDGAAIAVNKGNKELVDEFNKILDKWIAEGKIDEFVTNAVELTESK